MINIISKIRKFIYNEVQDGRLCEPCYFMKMKRRDLVNTLRLDIVDLLEAQKIHEDAFKKYKNCNYGKDVAIIAPGPSLNNYKPLENVLNIGLNRTVFRKDIHFKYFFMQDYIAVKDYINELSDERFKNTDKFFGIIQDYTYEGKATVPESVALRLGAKRYCIFNNFRDFDFNFHMDIASAPLATANSVAGSAMQFALYTNPKRIYLVGCDCSKGYFNEKDKKEEHVDFLYRAWFKIKKFADIWYPETEIISINPVGLKGLFTDIYQE